MKYTLFKSSEYQDWISGETMKSRVQVAKRLVSIEQDGHFGDHKDLEDYVWELKWGNGRRIYYAYIPESKIILLLGGNKNGQDKDITQAKKILKRWNSQNEA
jgi:putative addiction module killer protein